MDGWRCRGARSCLSPRGRGATKDGQWEAIYCDKVHVSGVVTAKSSLLNTAMTAVLVLMGISLSLCSRLRGVGCHSLFFEADVNTLNAVTTRLQRKKA